MNTKYISLTDYRQTLMRSMGVLHRLHVRLNRGESPADLTRENRALETAVQAVFHYIAQHRSYLTPRWADILSRDAYMTSRLIVHRLKANERFHISPVHFMVLLGILLHEAGHHIQYAYTPRNKNPWIEHHFPKRAKAKREFVADLIMLDMMNQLGLGKYTGRLMRFLNDPYRNQSLIHPLDLIGKINWPVKKRLVYSARRKLAEHAHQVRAGMVTYALELMDSVPGLSLMSFVDQVLGHQQQHQDRRCLVTVNLMKPNLLSQ